MDAFFLTMRQAVYPVTRNRKKADRKGERTEKYCDAEFGAVVRGTSESA